MNICVCGWFLLPELMAQLKKVSEKHDVYIVSHSQNKALLDTFGINYCIIPNVGLEFGAYDHYLKNIWDGKSDVLFMHDDVKISDISFFDEISQTKYSQAYVFKSEHEAKCNQNMHGRGIFCSGKFLDLTMQYQCRQCGQANDRFDTHNPDTLLLGCGPHRGFWHDIRNLGHSKGKPPAGIRHFNDGIYHFETYVIRMDGKIHLGVRIFSGRSIINDKFDAGRRGEWLHRKREDADNAKNN